MHVCFFYIIALQKLHTYEFDKGRCFCVAVCELHTNKLSTATHTLNTHNFIFILNTLEETIRDGVEAVAAAGQHLHIAHGSSYIYIYIYIYRARFRSWRPSCTARITKERMCMQLI